MRTVTTWGLELSRFEEKPTEFLFDGQLHKADSQAVVDMLATQFTVSYCGPSGKPFIAWSENFVYLIGTYDGMEWIECVPRNPVICDVERIGGG